MSIKSEHIFKSSIVWTGNKGEGTSDYKSYERSHTVSIANKPDILCSSDPYFRGEGEKHNPEDFLVSALSSCHMLWYLHLCSDNGIVVVNYTDHAVGTMVEKSYGGGYFTEVVLNPEVSITDVTKIELANSLHKQANEKCFIANSCNFPVKHNPSCMAAQVN